MKITVEKVVSERDSSFDKNSFSRFQSLLRFSSEGFQDLLVFMSVKESVIQVNQWQEERGWGADYKLNAVDKGKLFFNETLAITSDSDTMDRCAREGYLATDPISLYLLGCDESLRFFEPKDFMEDSRLMQDWTGETFEVEESQVFAWRELMSLPRDNGLFMDVRGMCAPIRAITESVFLKEGKIFIDPQPIPSRQGL